MNDCLNILLQVIYRIKLPGSVILGEGKPENQNHAIIFTRGEVLQTIDMNQVPQANIYIYRVFMCLALCMYAFALLEIVGNSLS